MLDAFVIAFIHCAAQRCIISYPRPGQTYSSYRECQAQLPETASAHRFDLEHFQGSEIACIEIPPDIGGDEWIVRETSNLRKGPSVDAEVIGTVKRGTTFHVFGQERKWLDIKTADGATGFLWADRAEKVHAPHVVSGNEQPAPAR